jgi:hypothetical protein
MSEYHPHQPISGHERVGFLHGNFTMFATQLWDIPHNQIMVNHPRSTWNDGDDIEPNHGYFILFLVRLC